MPQPILKTTDNPKAWYVHARFGAVLHWGIYSHSGREASWGLQRSQTTYEDYERYRAMFEARDYDPREWARQLRKAGIRYAMLATKHHDGFALWDTKFSDYKATNSPAGRDLLTPYVEALRAEGLRVAFYYSLLDWHHEHFPIDSVHPLAKRIEDLKGGGAGTAGGRAGTAPRAQAEIDAMNATRDMRIYAQFMRDQVRELLTEFGPIDIMWFDFTYDTPMPGFQLHEKWMGKGARDWESEKLYKLARELQPNMLIDNRLGLSGKDFPIDIDTPEQFVPQSKKKMARETVPSETCISFIDQWAHLPTAPPLRPYEPALLIQTLVHLVSVGSNMVLGVGPTAYGPFSKRTEDELNVYATWMALHHEAIYGCGASEFDDPADCRLTQNGNRLFVHLFAWPFRHLHLPGLAGRISQAKFLHNGLAVPFANPGWSYLNAFKFRDDGMETLELPIERPDVIVPVIEITLKD